MKYNIFNFHKSIHFIIHSQQFVKKKLLLLDTIFKRIGKLFHIWQLCYYVQNTVKHSMLLLYYFEKPEYLLKLTFKNIIIFNLNKYAVPLCWLKKSS